MNSTHSDFRSPQKEAIDRLHFVLQATKSGIWELDPATWLVHWDAQCQDLYGSSEADTIPYAQLLTYIHPDDLPLVEETIRQALLPGNEPSFDLQFRTVSEDMPRWLHSKGQVYLNPQGHPYHLLALVTDVTAEVVARQKLNEFQQHILSSFEQSPVGIATLDEENLTFRLVNSSYSQLVGRTPEQLSGKPLLEALPEIEGQGFDQLLKQVIATGIPYVAKTVAVQLMRNQQLETVYVDFTYQPQHQIDGRISGVLVVVIDVTEQVLYRQKVEASEAKLRSIIMNAPAAMGLFVGRDLVVEMPNQTFIDIVGKGPDIEGKPLREVMPELVTENQPFLQILDDVYTSGKMFQSFGAQVQIVQQGVMTYNYYNITYTPLFDAEGKVFAILDIAIDVTDAVKARQELENTESALRGTVELAQLAMWEMNIATNTFHYSQRFMDWLGFSEDTQNLDNAYNPLPEAYRQSVIDALTAVIQPGSSGIYENEHPIINRLTGQMRMIRAQAVVFRDEQGNPSVLRGTAQDITEYRQLQLALKQQVEQRTEELATANEELAATNEELAEANIQLLHSNEELSQYAYVASHDLQEPLRKIRLFSSMLGRDSHLSEANKALVHKITSASERMSLLIRSLLDFSRLLKADALWTPVDLTEVVMAIRTDFEIAIQEKKAQIHVAELPVIEAVNLQMNQLFYNLFSNALKFVRPDTEPELRIEASEISLATVRKYILQPLSYARYYHITFQDNGIGLEAEYAEQIFEVFKRLHERDLYPGSGIGLALCRRIVTNHNGYIYAESEVNQGTTFHLILPDRQSP